ncbi:hypothetical protein AVL50_08670 [Flammeovirga sp. SJP92]|nr:hypothetical protein AVL50_08670 [Flammeovirga sp. SJP92]
MAFISEVDSCPNTEQLARSKPISNFKLFMIDNFSIMGDKVFLFSYLFVLEILYLIISITNLF